MSMAKSLVQDSYTTFASAWNEHADVFDWKALAALVAGGLLAIAFAWLVQVIGTPLISCLWRTKVQVQCPIVIHIAPNPDKLPRLRDPKAPIVRRGGKNTTIPATAEQWNNMRAALGPNVPNKALAELLQKHGNDVHSAVEDYFGLQAGARW
jgi:hypothetical protein